MGKAWPFLTYSAALDRLGVKGWVNAGQALGREGLSDLGEWTVRHASLPKVDALIVAESTRLPGAGFLRAHGFEEWNEESTTWWLREAFKSITFDWNPYLASGAWAEVSTAPAENLGRVQEEEEPEGQRGTITGTPAGSTRVGTTQFTVADILQWMAEGKSEDQILKAHTVLKQADIRASLAYAAERERKAGKPTFTERWAGKFQLPTPDPKDEKLTFLLERYERNRK